MIEFASAIRQLRMYGCDRKFPWRQPRDARFDLCCDPTLAASSPRLDGGLLEGNPSGPSQLHCGLNRLDALGPNRDGKIKRSLKPSIGVD
jgi:hypothetical protein